LRSISAFDRGFAGKYFRRSKAIQGENPCPKNFRKNYMPDEIAMSRIAYAALLVGI
jgi:hypothetical protein